jgi:hypothetical protein
MGILKGEFEILMKRLFLAAIAVFVIAPTSPSLAINKKTELQLMKRACRMQREDYTDQEIINEISYLVRINSPPMERVPPPLDRSDDFINGLVRNTNKLIDDAEKSSSTRKAIELINKAFSMKCKF